jgi:hypothetical protein
MPQNISVTPEQALQLLQRLGIQGFLDKNAAAASSESNIADSNGAGGQANGHAESLPIPQNDNNAVPVFGGYPTTTFGKYPPNYGLLALAKFERRHCLPSRRSRQTLISKAA